MYKKRKGMDYPMIAVGVIIGVFLIFVVSTKNLIFTKCTQVNALSKINDNYIYLSFVLSKISPYSKVYINLPDDYLMKVSKNYISLTYKGECKLKEEVFDFTVINHKFDVVPFNEYGSNLCIEHKNNIMKRCSGNG